MRWIRPIALLAAAFLMLGAGGCAARRGWNVLLITLDTTRADRLGCYGYTGAETPNIDALASRGARFRTAVAQVPVTLPSHASILTGTFPIYHGARNNANYPLPEENVTLAEVFRGAGYATAAVVASRVLFRGFHLDQGFDRYDDRVRDDQTDPSGKYRRGEVVTRLALDEIRRMSGGGKGGGGAVRSPFFLWVHYYDAHNPYHAPEPFRSRHPAPYDAEIAYADACVGDLVEGLEGLGLRDRTLVVLTADHGEGLRDPHNEDTHGILLYEETLRIPLLFSAPGLVPEGRSLGGVARSVDIVPTILELVGLAIPPSVQGASLAASIRSGEDPPDRPSYFETLMPREAYGWAAMKGYRTRRWKYVQAPRPELFDLEGDPREARNLAAREPRRLLEMRRGLADLEARFGRPGAGTPHRGSLDPEIVRNLEALGYVVSTAPGTAAPSNKDPKDFIEVQNDLNLAGTLMDAGRREEAMAALDRALERDPGNLEVLRRKGVAYLETGDLARAKETFLRMTSLAPSDFMAHFRLGQVYRDLAKRAQGAGKEEEAEGARADAVRSYTRALSLFPGHALSLLDLANILARQGDRERAVEMYRQSYESDPDLLEPHFNRGILLRDLGRRDEARREFEWILANRPEPEWKPLGVDTLLRDLGGPGGEPRRR